MAGGSPPRARGQGGPEMVPQVRLGAKKTTASGHGPDAGYQEM
jgi:hypothetical protein